MSAPTIEAERAKLRAIRDDMARGIQSNADAAWQRMPPGTRALLLVASGRTGAATDEAGIVRRARGAWVEFSEADRRAIAAAACDLRLQLRDAAMLQW